MTSWRCSICDAEWPPESPYERCPQCGEETWSNRDGKPDKDCRSRADAAWRERRSEAEARSLTDKFRGWLDTVSADDFDV